MAASLDLNWSRVLAATTESGRWFHSGMVLGKNVDFLYSSVCAWGDVVCLGVVLASAMAALGGGWCVFGLDVDEVVVVFVEGFESCLFPTLLEGGPC